MKRFIYPAAVSIATAALFIYGNILLNLSGQQITGFGFILIQGILAIKFVTGSMLVIPSKISYRQIIPGFLAADAGIALWMIIGRSASAFPVYILTAQIILSAYYLASGWKNQRTSEKIPAVNINSEMIVRW